MRPPLVCTSLVLSVVTAACSGRSGAIADSTVSVASAATPPASASCTPLETRPPEVAGQQPATPGQTRACAVTSNVAFDVTVVARGLEKPWAVEPLPEGDLLVTEKNGRLRIVSAAGQVSPPIAGLPAVDARGQGGLLDVALSPSFDRDRTIYWSFSEPREKGNATSVARGVLSADRSTLDEVRVIFRALPAYQGTLHYGSRLLFGPDGMLYLTLGERSDQPIGRCSRQQTAPERLAREPSECETCSFLRSRTRTMHERD